MENAANKGIRQSHPTGVMIFMKNIFLSVLILAAGCVPVEKVSGSGGELIQIKQGNVGTFYKLRIGVTNIIKADYIDDAGIKKHGLIAILTLFIEGNPPQEKDFKVHAGQKIIMDKYSVYVEEIRGTVKGLVTLRIKSIKGDGSN